MSDDYIINEAGEIIFKDGVDRVEPEQKDPLWVEYIKLEYEVVNNHRNPTKDPVKIARYKELKKYFDDEKTDVVSGKNHADGYADALNKAREKIKQEMIASDESPDNSVLYTAITNFKKRNE